MLGASPIFLRAQSLLAHNYVTEATEEVKDLADRLSADPVSLAQLGVWTYESNLPRASTFIGELLAKAGPTKTLTAAPRPVMQLALPLAYPAIVEQETRTDGVDGLLLMALMRQESIYDRYAGSSVGARGLTQVMPETGASIAKTLGVEGFTTADLYRPEISIDFGSHYLSEGIKRYGGNAWVALAAYNAGPGSADKWLQGAKEIDPDIFYERVAFAETKSYVKLVGRNYYLYQKAWR